MNAEREKSAARYITAAELMATFNISRSTVGRLIDAGLPVLWIGAARRFAINKIMDWLEGTGEKD